MIIFLAEHNITRFYVEMDDVEVMQKGQSLKQTSFSRKHWKLAAYWRTAFHGKLDAIVKY